MRIHSLTIDDFRGFERLSLDLDRPLTVVVGVNGAGKTTVLDAIALLIAEAMRPFQYGVEWALPYLDPSDIRHDATRVALRGRFVHEGKAIDCETSRKRDMGPIMMAEPDWAMSWRGTRWRLAAYYEATRTVSLADKAFRPVEETETHPYLQLFKDWVSAPREGFASFFRWFKAREDVENEQKVAREDLKHQDPQLAAVRGAVTSMVPGFAGLRVQRDPLHLAVRKHGVSFYVDQLSEGERNLLVMVADLARRLAVANPDLENPLLGEAIVLIDEIELHLHPSWQRTVVHDLRRTFPNCQFIVTTHSPQVLSEVPNDAVVLVKDFQCYRPAAPTAGRDSNSILTEVLGVTSHPAEVTAEIEEILGLVDARRDDEARTRVDALAERVTERDPEVARLRMLTDVVERLDVDHPEGR